MKWQTFIFLITIAAICSYRMRKYDNINPDAVKSPGGFDNVAPDASNIISPILAKPKIDVKLQVTSDALVQRTDYVATTKVPGYKKVFDEQTKSYETVPDVQDQKIMASTTKWATIDNYKTVTLDVESGKVIKPKTVELEHQKSEDSKKAEPAKREKPKPNGK